MLENESAAIDDFGEHVVFKALERILDDFPRVALVVAFEVLHVLQHERLWALLFENASNIEKESALRFV